MVPWVIDRRWAVGLCAGLLLLGAWRQPPQPGWPGDWAVLACDVGQGGVVPYLPLNELTRPAQPQQGGN